MGSIFRKLAAGLAGLCAAVMFVQPVLASTPVTVTGTSDDRGADAELIKVVDGNVFVHLILRGQLHGAIEGFRVDDAITVLHPDGTFTAHGTGTCDCTVAGRTGTWTEGFDANGMTGVSVFVRLTVLSGSGGLSNLHAVGFLSGVPGGAATYSISYHFEG